MFETELKTVLRETVYVIRNSENLLLEDIQWQQICSL